MRAAPFAHVVPALLALAPAARAEVRQVGPAKTYAAPCAAIAASADGDTIQIDAAGTYVGDVCAVARSRLTIVGVNGRPKIDAGGKNAQGKGIWVVTGDDTTVDNVELTGAKVPDANGAGIRQEGRNLTVLRSYFHDNENGILSGERADSTITVERSEFADNGAGDGFSHNLYIGKVARLVFRFNYSHHARVGHLLKSRALVNLVAYNRLTDEATSNSSYEVNLPSAGTSYVIGNVVHQGPDTGNSAIIDYGSEPGTFNPTTDLYVVNNTVVNERAAGGTFVQIGANVTTPARLVNNVFFGPGNVTNQAGAQQTTNYTGAAPMFLGAASYDYRLLPGSPCANAGTKPASVGAMSLVPAFHYVHPASANGRSSAGPAIDIGAYELDGDAPLGDGGAPGPDGSATGLPDGSATGLPDGGLPPEGGSSSASSGAGTAAPAAGDADDGGCACRAAAPARASGTVLAPGAIAVVLLRRRGRRREISGR